MGTAKTGIDIISYLKAQHEHVKGLLGLVASSTGKQREEAFYNLRRTLAVHETIEETILHPAAREALPQGDVIVKARLAEEHQAKEVLSALEGLPVDSPEFETKFTAFKGAVIAHATSEETQEFADLQTRLPQDKLEMMRKRAEVAEALAPTRPHPGLGESALGNMLAGPFAAMVDRARDALTHK